MTAPVPADMDSCDPKCRCLSGPYADIAFSCESPCSSGTFDCQDGCTSDSGIDGPGCYLFTSVIEGSPIGEQGQTEDSSIAYFNLATQGDYFNNTYAEPFYDEFSLRGPSFTPGPDGPYQSSPANGTCEGTTRPGFGCPADVAYYDPSETITFTRPADSSVAAQLYAWGWTRSQQSGTFDQYRSGPGTPNSTGGPGYTVTETPTITKSNLFPSWASCTNPYKLRIVARVVPGRVYNEAQGSWIPCDDCEVTYQSRDSVPFIEYDSSSIDVNFGCPNGCGLFEARRTDITFQATQRWERSNVELVDSPIRQGRINSEPYSETLSVVTGFISDLVASEVKIYLIQAVGATNTDLSTGEFEAPILKNLLGTWTSTCNKVNPDCR